MFTDNMVVCGHFFLKVVPEAPEEMRAFSQELNEAALKRDAEAVLCLLLSASDVVRAYVRERRHICFTDDAVRAFIKATTLSDVEIMVDPWHELDWDAQNTITRLHNKALLA
jgi:hypothetical protein